MEHDNSSNAASPDARLGQASLHEFFGRYANEFNEGLHGRLNTQALSALYAEAFVAATPAGVVTGNNDSALSRIMEEGLRRYHGIGMKRMKLVGVVVTRIDPLHALAHTSWKAAYGFDDGEVSVHFVNAYLVRLDAHGALKVFGWVTGDEEEAMRKHGIG